MNTRSVIIIYEVIRESPTLSPTMSAFKRLCVIGPDRDPVDRVLVPHLLERYTAIIEMLLSSKLMLIQYVTYY